MKRKQLFMPLVVCGVLATGFSSCVDDNESPSVTNIRDAKAAQLTALAALANAEAEAALITANAEAALMAAQTAFQENQTEEAKAKFLIEIEQIKAEADAAIATAMANKADAEQKLLTDANTHVAALYTIYSNHAGNLVAKNRDLVNAVGTLTQLETGILDNEEFANNAIYAQNKIINTQQAIIKVVEENESLGTIDADAIALRLTEVNQLINNADALLIHNEVKTLQTSFDAVNDAPTLELATYEYTKNIFADKIEILNLGGYTVVEIGSPISTEAKYVRVHDQGSYYYFQSSSQSYFYYKPVVDLSDKLLAIDYAASLLKTESDALGTAADKVDKNPATAYSQLAVANAEMTTANKLPSTTPADKEAKALAIKEATMSIAHANDNLGEKQTAYDVAEEKYNEFNDALSSLDADLAAYNQSVADLLVLIAGNETAFKNYELAGETRTELVAEKTVLNTLSNSAVNLDQIVLGCRAAIAAAEKAIASVEDAADMADAQIAYQKEVIAALKLEIETVTALANHSKSVLDAAIAAQ